MNEEPVATDGNSTAPDDTLVNERYVGGCTTRDECKDKRGVCKTKCEAHEDSILHGCSGHGCWCCFKRCKANEECREAKGKCQSKSCGSNRREIHKGCGKGCWCCAPRREYEHGGYGGHGKIRVAEAETANGMNEGDEGVIRVNENNEAQEDTAQERVAQEEEEEEIVDGEGEEGQEEEE